MQVNCALARLQQMARWQNRPGRIPSCPSHGPVWISGHSAGQALASVSAKCEAAKTVSGFDPQVLVTHSTLGVPASTEHSVWTQASIAQHVWSHSLSTVASRSHAHRAHASS